MGEPCGVFQVADGEFAGGVAAVVSVGFDRRGFSVLVPVGVLTGVCGERFGVFPGVGLVVSVGFDRRQVEVGDERVVPPVGEQLSLGTEQAGAAYHQTNLASLRPLLGVGHLHDRFPDLCFTVWGIADTGLSVFADVGDQCPDLVVHLRSDRTAHPQIV